MQCPQCQHENREGAKFCAGCGSPLAITCASCGNKSPPGAAFCDNCGKPLTGQPTSPGSAQPDPKPAAEPEPLSYTPQHLAEKILTSRSALEGERKQVTVMFADIKDSTELIRDLDPEAAQQLLDPAIHIMMDAVHRFEGTVSGCALRHPARVVIDHGRWRNQASSSFHSVQRPQTGLAQVCYHDRCGSLSLSWHSPPW